MNLHGIGTVYFDNRQITNIISLSKVKISTASYDSAEGNKLIMLIPNKEVLLNDIHNRIYYHDMEDRDLVLVNTVEENREGLSCRELSGARDSRRTLEMFSYSSQKTFENMVHIVKNPPVRIEDVCNASTIYG